jgi:thiol:disulfide interchange protein DsbC
MKKLLCLLLGVSLGAGVLAASDATPKAADPRAVIASKFPSTKPEDVRPSLIPGIYEVTVGSDIAYVSADGRYLINGDLFEVDSRTNLTEAVRERARSKVLASLDERDMIIFAPTAAKHTITVFTDVDCAYCRKLHSEIDQLTKLGVRVRYAAYPRAGPGSEDWAKMEAVWCSKDRKDAITRAKRGEEVKAASCGATPVGKQFELGDELGVRGTPAIYTTAGQYIGGYLPPASLLKELDSLKATTAKPKK